MVWLSVSVVTEWLNFFRWERFSTILYAWKVTLPFPPKKKPTSPALSFLENPGEYRLTLYKLTYLAYDYHSTIMHTWGSPIGLSFSIEDLC